jgi:DNA polymerase I-like protein with 3'-5' exonuclease and polymerase domains
MKEVTLGLEPDKYNKKGEVSKAWLQWEAKRTKEPEITGRWRQWQEKLEKVKTTQHFNLNSSDQLRWLFYTKLGYEPVVYTKSETDPQPSTGKDALPGFGELGKILKSYKDDVKLLQMVAAYIERCDDKGILRVQMKIPGTLSGRLSGG